MYDMIQKELYAAQELTLEKNRFIYQIWSNVFEMASNSCEMSHAVSNEGSWQKAARYPPPFSTTQQLIQTIATALQTETKYAYVELQRM